MKKINNILFNLIYKYINLDNQKQIGKGKKFINLLFNQLLSILHMKIDILLINY